ncbi:sensor histidine kinase [Haliovirga abyssi]|uniref:histidine kinase n=1 Tax=Haliovirga abyssi TaxID=2996794 RepID=A0AAU9E082_9FUSO|nr:HAMP domain-containing sensor histidine kinase [Haliovirga abyssi]BDU49710.1 two-component sensor histidine kinase [Haliovirga abyssi]
MKIKMSLTIKFYLIIVSSLIFAIGISILISNFMLSKYYIVQREKKIKNIAVTLQEIDVNSAFKDEFEKLKNKNDINILFLNKVPDFIAENSMLQIMMALSYVTKDEIKRVYNGEIILKKEYSVITSRNEIIVLTKTKNGIILALTSSIASVKEYVNTVIRFGIFTGIIALILTIFINGFFVKKILFPLKKLKEIAEKMAKLDFSDKFDIETGDEIEEFGKTFNYLSNELEFNLTKIKSVSEKLTLEIKKEKEIERKRKEFIGNVSHELKTPIALIMAYSEGLKDNVAIVEDRNYYCDVISSEAKKMDNLVKELLGLMKIEKEEKKLKFEKIKIRDIIKKTIKKFDFDLKELGVKLKCSKNQNNDYIVMADIVKIEQVLDNLISNAINNVNKNGIISIDVLEKNSKIEIEIYNSGSHIPADKIDEIWEPFVKLDKSRNRKYGGTGLGLSIVKGIIKIHNSEIKVENIDNGVKFSFFLEMA